MFKHFPTSVIWMAILFAALGTGGTLSGIHQLRRNWQFDGPVERTLGMVEREYTTTSTSRHGSSTHYHIQYRYRADDSTQLTTSATVDLSTYGRYNAQAPIPIKFLPQNHAISRIDLPVEDHNAAVEAWIMTCAGLVFGGLGWFAFFGLERLILYRHWLRKNGERCTGRVKEIVTTSGSVGKEPVRYLVYTYTDRSGGHHSDSSEGLSGKDRGDWVVGDTLEVFCDPRDSSRSTAILVPLGGRDGLS